MFVKHPLSSAKSYAILIIQLFYNRLHENSCTTNDRKKESFMARGSIGKNNWALLIMILAGVVLGGLIGQLASGVSALSWLNYGQTFGLSNPLVLDFGILVLTFGLTIKITIAGILGIVLAIIIYHFI